ncbi:hemerythrin domain-containing protein [Amycolatopsis sp., V23-08]|uniref:Hemerythrin domain-containing protein n=1 Tax=Amycolatopsis heterodermiae TaxID=3110235 RepID=A0ABU5RLF7_9PSEU|nr:hemerythrin domain-containing protein [Amycolatopsis sp., V23-08]MEA5367125.1 hemerythrin domain-containing protein [Amycolatopsis sp., V23-08]
MADHDEDVIALLQRQHGEIRAMFADLETAADDRRKEVFRDLVRLLAVHETAEEEVVHPEIRDLEPAAETVVEARLGEEHRAKELLTTLQKMGPDADGFDTLLVQLRDDVLAHAEHEEREEFPFLRAHHSPERLRAMAATVRLAEAVAPTRPHPGVESAKANLLLGPPAAIMDRARDVIRTALGK